MHTKVVYISTTRPHSFISEFLYQLLSVGIVEHTAVATINPNLSNDFHPRVATEAQEAGVDLPVSVAAKKIWSHRTLTER